MPLRKTNFFQKVHFLTVGPTFPKMLKNVGLSVTNPIAIDSSRPPGVGRHAPNAPTYAHSSAPIKPGRRAPPGLASQFFEKGSVESTHNSFFWYE